MPRLRRPLALFGHVQVECLYARHKQTLIEFSSFALNRVNSVSRQQIDSVNAYFHGLNTCASVCDWLFEGGNVCVGTDTRTQSTDTIKIVKHFFWLG